MEILCLLALVALIIAIYATLTDRDLVASVAAVALIGISIAGICCVIAQALAVLGTGVTGIAITALCIYLCSRGKG